jgi:hypothetical protein
MAALDLVGVHSRKKWRRGRLEVAPAPDLLKRDFSASRPDERWVADITEFMTGEGKLFLAGVKDLYGRGLVGWSMGTRQTSELVIEAVSMAVARRDPLIPPLHHSDKGCQYTSLDFTNRLHELGLVPSYGSTGDCYDNAAMETFWATLKRELSWIHGPLIYMNRARLRSALFDYIEIFYNRERALPEIASLTSACSSSPRSCVDIQAAILCDFAQVREGVLFVSSGCITRFGIPPEPMRPAPMPLYIATVIEVGPDPDEFQQVHEVNVRVSHSGSGTELGRATLGFQTRRPPQLNAGESLMLPLAFPLSPVPIQQPGAHDIHVSVDGGDPRMLTAYAVDAPSPPAG